MASTVLNSKPAVEMSVFVVRAFVRLREVVSANRQIATRIEELEERLETHDGTIQDIIDAIRRFDEAAFEASPQDRVRSASREGGVIVDPQFPHLTSPGRGVWDRRGGALNRRRQ